MLVSFSWSTLHRWSIELIYICNHIVQKFPVSRDVTVITLHFPINKVTRLRTLLKRGTGKLKMGTKPNLNPSRFSNSFLILCLVPIFYVFFPCALSPFPFPRSPLPVLRFPVTSSLFPVSCTLFAVPRSPFPVPRLITSHGTYNTFFFSAVAPCQPAAL